MFLKFLKYFINPRQKLALGQFVPNQLHIANGLLVALLIFGQTDHHTLRRFIRQLLRLLDIIRVSILFHLDRKFQHVHNFYTFLAIISMSLYYWPKHLLFNIIEVMICPVKLLMELDDRI